MCPTCFTDVDLFTILTTGHGRRLARSEGGRIDIVSLGIERDGFRNGRLAINASMVEIDPKTR